MLTNVCQRWNSKRASYRPAGEVINPRALEVAEIPHHKIAKEFVEAHHYSGSFPAARACFGLYESASATLVGALVFSVPCTKKVLSNVFGREAKDCVELGRLVLLDRVPANAETFFLSRAFKQVKGRFKGVVSFSDPMPRKTQEGLEVFKGHIGTIYQAHNATFLGRSTARSLKILPGGEVLSDRSLQKIRKLERGWKYSAGLLENYGAEPLEKSFLSARDWLKRWLPFLTTTVRHPGNYRYAWSLERGLKLPEGFSYPKVRL